MFCLYSSSEELDIDDDDDLDVDDPLELDDDSKSDRLFFSLAVTRTSFDGFFFLHS